MRYAAFVGGLALSLCLAACDNEPEDTPDIADAIPLDDGSEGALDEGSEGGVEDAGSDTPVPANAPSTAPTNTMESGSNADGGRAPDPSRTKLIPAD
jgi:hypothetical protein